MDSKHCDIYFDISNVKVDVTVLWVLTDSQRVTLGQQSVSGAEQAWLRSVSEAETHDWVVSGTEKMFYNLLTGEMFHMYIYIHMYIYVCVYIHVYVCVCMYVFMRAECEWDREDVLQFADRGDVPYVHLHTRIYIRVCVYTRVCVCVSTYLCVRSVSGTEEMIHMYICMYIYIYVCVHIYVCVCVCMYVFSLDARRVWVGQRRWDVAQIAHSCDAVM